MAQEQEQRRSFAGRCLQVFNGGHLVIVILSALGIAGSAVGVYTSLRGDIQENRRAIVDMQKDLDEQKRYNAELRTRIVEADTDIRAAQRQIVEQLIDLAGKK